MKKLNLWIAVIAGILFFFGNYFKIQHWPGASVLMMLGGPRPFDIIKLFLPEKPPLSQP